MTYFWPIVDNVHFVYKISLPQKKKVVRIFGGFQQILLISEKKNVWEIFLWCFIMLFSNALIEYGVYRTISIIFEITWPIKMKISLQHVQM